MLARGPVEIGVSLEDKWKLVPIKHPGCNGGKADSGKHKCRYEIAGLMQIKSVSHIYVGHYSIAP